MNKFEDFIFTDALSNKLKWWLETTTISPLCFYGNPGNGKTSFAKFISNTKGDSVLYEDCNEVKSSFKQMFERISSFARTFSLLSDDKDWDKVLVLDEFHNLTATQMDYFKVPFEQWSESGIQIIVCCNTGKRLPIQKTLTPALISRLELISFDTAISDRDELTVKVLNKFPQLSEHTVHNLLPDYRKITKQTKLYKTDALVHFTNLINTPTVLPPKKVKHVSETHELVFDE